MIQYDIIDTAITEILADTDLDGWSLGMRRIAIYSAITAVAASKPTEFGIEAELDRVTDGSFQLDQRHDQLLDVLRLTDPKGTGGSAELSAMTPAQADSNNPCWRDNANSTDDPTAFVWSEKTPRSVRIFGRVNDGLKLLCRVSVVPEYDNVAPGLTLNVRDTLFDAVLDAALDRCCQRRRPYAQDAMAYANRHAAHMQLIIENHKIHNPMSENNAS